MTPTASARELMEAALRAHQAGELSQAVDFYRQFLVLRPGHPDALNNLGNALLQLGKPDEAIDACRRALATRAAYAEAHLNIGMALQKLGRLGEAMEAYRQALAVRPDFVQAINSLGTALQQNGQLDEAASTYRKAVELAPGYRDALNNLGNTLRESGQLEAAIDVFRQALSHHPYDAEVLNNLGITLEEIGNLDEAERSFREAIRARPRFAQAFYNLGNTLQKKGNLDDTIAAFQEALGIDPEMVEAWVNLGNVLCESGRAAEAFEHYRRAVAIRPNSRFGGTLIFALNFDPAITPQQLREEQERWNRQYAQPLRPLIRPHTNDRAPERRLKVGYVSPDLGNHPVGRFMAPLLSHHDHALFEIFCYSDTARFDVVSEKNRSCVDVWRQTVKLPDEWVADQVRQDAIDILVDLTMHSSANRLLAFARKPAPVQVTYLAYPGSTGLETMDYRLTDPYIDPAEARRDGNYPEESLRLPHTFWCYATPPEACETGLLPAMDSGRLTFGCLNSFSKVSSVILDGWIRLLRQVPDSRLILHAREGSHRQRTRDRLGAAGVDPRRLEFVGFLPTTEYFRQYQRIDIALDTFPYAGGTTTCDALWMGLPVVTLAGQTAISRGGASILSTVGLESLVAQSADQYVRVAAQLAADLPALAALRDGMRARMRASPLMDAAGFARDVEAAYRQIWRRWCAAPRASPHKS
jgi:predicted O-linked N-acetylglucosamine transferase (SPINDLY family)